MMIGYVLIVMPYAFDHIAKLAIVYAVNVFFVTYKVSQVSVCNATSLTCFLGSLRPKIPS